MLFGLGNVRLQPVAAVATVACLVVSLLSPSLSTPAIKAAVSNPAPLGKVSFTFDDGYESFITEAAPTLAQHGMSGTAYMTTDFIGQPNYMTWEQTAALQNQYGWEIGSHSKSHPLMTEITPEQIEEEVAQSKQVLQDHGFNPTSYATPFGDYNDKVVAAIAKYYAAHRPFHDVELPNTWPYRDYLLQVKQVQAGVSVNQVKQYIDDAKANNTWLILVFHDIKDQPSPNPENYEYATDDLNDIAGYVKSQNIKTANISESLVTVDNDKLPNNAFTAGLAEGWRTDSPSNVTADSERHGAFPEPERSIKMVSAIDRAVHLFSPLQRVDPSSTYVVKSYINIVKLANGEVALYIDEYDANGNWISGQYKGAVSVLESKNLNVVYNPSSAKVSNAGLQFIVTANSGIVAYVDNVQWFAVTPESPGSDPEPGQPGTNLFNNSDFDDGLSQGWTTDNAASVTADSQGNGSPLTPQNSIKMLSTASNIHLFSDKVAVEPSQIYKLNSFVNVSQRQSGEAAFYVDEYDAGGSWISGQYLSNIQAVGSHNVNFPYTPSSANVAKASLQVIVTANSGITAYVDDTEWLAPATAPEEPESPGPGEPEQPDGTNLLSNSSFDSGISQGWTTDSASYITADSNNNGSPASQQHSVKLSNGKTDGNAHLFSDKVAVQPSKNYILGSYLDVTEYQNGEVAFYIDEYDANGNWISGQYIFAKRNAGRENIQFAYTPTSGNVAGSRLQIITTPDSGITAYLDEIFWKLVN